MDAPELRIEVVYALPRRQVLKSLRVAVGTTVGEAIAASGLLVEFPRIDPARDALGIFGQLTTAEQVLRDGDRVEIYRPLQIDPKEARRDRAQQERVRQQDRRFR